MKVFLSHAIADKTLINILRDNCNRNGLQLLIAEHHLSLTSTITQKIELMIRESHIALFLLTEKGINSKFVQQEIGYIKSLNKPALYIVQTGLEHLITGFAYGRDYIELNPGRPDEAIRKAVNRLMQHWKKIYDIQAKERQNVTLFITGLVALGLIADSK